MRTICEVNGGYDESQGFDNVEEVINKAIPNIFNFDFPIYDPSYKNVLCHKILLEYYTREIAFETVGLWKLKLRSKLNKIMPYYNQLYKSELLEFNPFYDVDLEKTYNKKGDESNFSDSTSNTNSTETFNSTNEQTEKLTGNKGVNSKYGEVSNNTGSNKGTTTDEQKVTNTKVNDSTTVIEFDSTKDDTSKNDKINKISDTPQSVVTNVKDGKYLTSAQVDEIKQTDKSVVKDKTKNVATILDDDVQQSNGKNITDITSSNKNEVNGITDNSENYTDNKTGKQTIDNL